MYTVDDEKEYARGETHSEPGMVKAGSTAGAENHLRDMALNGSRSLSVSGHGSTPLQVPRMMVR